ncbi:rhomboid family intramembrane serine protease [Streptomyces sp. NBC_01220]|uniref:Rhomboid family intramembrane serine protease n=1 Tax=Streptomyces poriferorum TaxID=2798799 RepID=A0ABY9J1Q2_9ACTN|nr:MULTISPECIES: rhomboid family intramembrane serine protease [Streptomyces]WSQ49009.1 rhomboid family intramembrane serine protease [Streptomyces sp. NBC_01220]MBW5260090.1 rhomboid family intramembrane serine protease [Streptomyces poriferorum]MDP5313237.1 rhomboid family intramembrane serine protease [Streptomyces sp. Alt4]WLQ61758.1 rhomboid family intramembrane serine protease [Streptomyces sp. Alt2]WSI68323.1 rhomboid family intramembrane serine protease [Streptomyces sp. NBC_01336]
MDQQPPGGQGPTPPVEGPVSCYRHPGRETAIRCTRCDRPICPDCMVSASVGFQCPDCVRQGSGTGHHPAASRPRTIAGGAVAADPRLITKILLGINAAVFLAVLANDALINDLTLLGQAPYYPYGPVQGVAEGQWYRLFTSMFLHEAVWHFAFNMLGLWWLGGPLEAVLGRARYLALYLISGLAGGALTYWLAAPNQPSLGASGAIFGLLGATVVLMRRLNYDMRPVFMILALNLVITFNPWGGIAWQAHVGGLVAGVLIGIGMVHAPRERRNLVQFGTCAAVLVAVILIVVARTAALT